MCNSNKGKVNAKSFYQFATALREKGNVIFVTPGGEIRRTPGGFLYAGVWYLSPAAAWNAVRMSNDSLAHLNSTEESDKK